jgi:hypothetical protein
MSFGFSVGDFISALELVGAIIASLREVGGAKAQFRELTRELFGLETALLRAKLLEFNEDLHEDYIALTQAACQCQVTIDDFWKQANRYQQHLLARGRPYNLKDAWMKIKWSLFKSDDLNRFKVDIAAHTQSILLLLTVVQMICFSLTPYSLT